MAGRYLWRRKTGKGAKGGNPSGGRAPVTVESFGKGFEVTVTGAGATVGHYLAALEGVPAAIGLSAERCRTCYRCCRGRIPLTIMDLEPLYRIAGLGRGVRTLPILLARYGWVTVRGRAVDVGLRTDEEGFCIFLDRSRGLCRVYTARPVVCRTYFCGTVGPRARKLRAALINVGMDELVRRWLMAALALGSGPVVHEALEMSLRLADWPPTAFAGRRRWEYVLLKDILSPGLWCFLTTDSAPEARLCRG